MNRLQCAPEIYLACGMRTAWQDTVTEQLKLRLLAPTIMFDPRGHQCKKEEQYTNWDLASVVLSDILFVYREADNPAGHGLALEVGFAVGMAQAGASPKHIIFAEEAGHPSSRYFGMVRVCSDVVVSTLAEGIDALIE